MFWFTCFFFFNQFQFLQARLGSRSQQSFCLGPRAEITSIATMLGSTHLQLCLFHHVTRLASERAAFSGWLFPSAPCWVPPHFSQLHWKTELWWQLLIKTYTVGRGGSPLIPALGKQTTSRRLPFRSVWAIVRVSLSIYIYKTRADKQNTKISF